MTDSTTKTEDKTKTKGKAKKTGPIRSGAVGSVTLLIVIILIFGKFFLDSTIKKTIEWSGSYLHGAEVNIQSVQTKIFQGEIILKGLAVTDKKKPENNLFQIAYAKFDLLMDAVLRAKIVIEDASLKGISINEKRKRPGKLYLRDKEKEDTKAIKKEVKNVAKVASKELEDNFLGNFASIASGDSAKDQLSSIKGNLKSEEKIKELEKVLEQKEKEWEEKLKTFKDNNELKDLAKEIKNVKFDKKKPWKSIKKYSELNKRVKSTISKYKNDSKQLKADIKYFDKSIKEMKKLVKEDTNSLSNHFSLSGFDSKSLAKVIFLKLLQEKLGEHYKYVEIAKEYLPNPKSKDKSEKAQSSFIPKKRGQGKNVHFPITTSYPFFWWKRGDISVKNEEVIVSGSIRDFTSTPAHLNEIAKIELAGSFPKEKIKSFTLNGSFDHRTAKTIDIVHLKIDDLMVKGQKFISSPKLGFSLKQANSRWNIKTVVQNENINFDINGLFQDSTYNVSSTNETIKELFTKAVSPINDVSFDAKAKGQWGNLDWNIRSSFADKLSRNLKSEVQNKINAVKDKYMSGIKEKLGLKTKELESKYSKIKNKFDEQIEKEKKKAEQMASSALKDSTKKADPVKEKSKKGLKKLLKKFKF